jgi:hypothetical protein
MPLLKVISLGRFLILMLSVSEPSVANFSGEITFNYQISDGYELTDAKLNLAVANLLDATVSSSLMIDNASTSIALAKSCAEVMVKLWSSFVESDTSARLIALWL